MFFGCCHLKYIKFFPLLLFAIKSCAISRQVGTINLLQMVFWCKTAPATFTWNMNKGLVFISFHMTELIVSFLECFIYWSHTVNHIQSIQMYTSKHWYLRVHSWRYISHSKCFQCTQILCSSFVCVLRVKLFLHCKVSVHYYFDVECGGIFIFSDYLLR